jgi:hypothetical protein
MLASTHPARLPAPLHGRSGCPKLTRARRNASHTPSLSGGRRTGTRWSSSPTRISSNLRCHAIDRSPPRSPKSDRHNRTTAHVDRIAVATRPFVFMEPSATSHKAYQLSDIYIERCAGRFNSSWLIRRDGSSTAESGQPLLAYLTGSANLQRKVFRESTKARPVVRPHAQRRLTKGQIFAAKGLKGRQDVPTAPGPTIDEGGSGAVLVTFRDGDHST